MLMERYTDTQMIEGNVKLELDFNVLSKITLGHTIHEHSTSENNHFGVYFIKIAKLVSI